MTNDKTTAKLRLSRRGLLGAAALGVAAPMFYVKNGWAAGKKMYVGTYTGAQGEAFRKLVIPKFQTDLDCQVFQTENITLGNIALLRTQKASPNYSVMMMDDLGIPLAKAENLIDKMPREKIPNLANAFPNYIYADDYGVAFAISIVTPWYSTALDKPITSYADMWDSRFAGRLLMISPKYSQSVHMLVMASAMTTGKPILEAQYELDKGWDMLAKLKPNVQTMYEASGGAILQVSQGQADGGGPDFSKALIPYMLKGAPIAQSSPKEGSFAGVNCMAMVKGAPEPDLGAAFIDRVLSKEVQKLLADTTYAGPSVKDVELSKEVAAVVSEEKIKKLIVLDWEKINPQRSAILERYNQIFV